VKLKTLQRYAGFVFSVAGARGAGIVLSSLTFPYLVRHLGVQSYGLWSYVIAVCGFLGLVSDPGLTTYVSQQVAARREQASDIIPDFLALRFLSSVVALAVLLLIVRLETRTDVRHLLCLYGIGLLLVSMLSSDPFLISLEMFHARSLLVLTQQSIYALVIFVCIRTPGDIFWMPIAILGSSALSGTAGWLLMWRKGFRMSTALQPQAWKGIIVPSAHYALATLMSTTYHRAGHLLVRWFLGDYALGLYSAAVRFIDLLRGFVVMVLNVFMPSLALAARSDDGLRRLAQFALAVVALISIPLTVGLIGTAPLVVPWVLGAKYLEDVTLIKWLAPYLVTASAASLFAGTFLYALGRHRAYLISTMSGAIAGSLLYAILIPQLGLTGAALGMVLAEFAVALAAYLLLPDVLRGLWRSAAIAVALAAASLMLVAAHWVEVSVPRVSVVVPAAALTYFLSCAWFLRKWVVQQRKELLARPEPS